MIYNVPEEFQRELNSFNFAQTPRVVDIYAVWDPSQERWTIWAIPVDHTSHPKHRKHITKGLCRPFPDGSGRMGVKLFNWCDVDGAFLPLDNRIFTALRWADTFSDRRHYENTIEEPEFKKELAAKKGLRAVAEAARRYWRKLDDLTISMDPTVNTQRGGRDWRSRKEWR